MFRTISRDCDIGDNLRQAQQVGSLVEKLEQERQEETGEHAGDPEELQHGDAAPDRVIARQRRSKSSKHAWRLPHEAVDSDPHPQALTNAFHAAKLSLTRDSAQTDTRYSW